MTPDCEPRFKEPRKMMTPRQLKRALMARSGGLCEARKFSPLCTGVGVTIHHVVRRSQGGNDHPDDTVLICDACHDRVHHSPAEALTAGLLRPGWAQ